MEAPDVDSRSKMQRQALGNVRRLFEKLDGSDKLEQRTERRFVIAGSSVVAIALAVLGISAVTRSPDPGAEARARCIQEARVAAVWQYKKELGQKHPGMPAAEIDKRVERHFTDMKSVATFECDGRYGEVS
jgi:hypothetical protein